jgi:hypothetical protein
MRDLIILVADKNMEFSVKGALRRHKSLGTRQLDFHILTHPNRDGGVRTTGSQLLSLERKQFRHGLLLLDIEGSGASDSALDLEFKLDGHLRADWHGDAKAIVIEPELEAWIWGSDNAMENVLEWKEPVHLREWLSSRSPAASFDKNQKPVRPKEAFEQVLHFLRKPRSSSQYEALTSKISLASCKDPAFIRLRDTLQRWFPPE